MWFGTLPSGEAEGAILAHGVRLPEGHFAKGRVLSDADIARLRTAGIDHVTVARLEPGDIGEDEAAARLAARLCGAGTSASAPFTGRVNLFADTDGVAVIEAAAIHALNRRDEAVTIATLPPFTPVRAGQMLATVKIIPFAVSEKVVTDLEWMMAGPAPVSLSPWQGLSVCLIQTVLDGTKHSVLDKTEMVTAARLDAVGARLARTLRLPHQVDGLTDALSHVTEDMVLVVGASAITDRRDVIPAALTAAGGTIRHFGMPVDPGNLLLLGEMDGRPVLGLPGCARSPKLNGVDWVLQRLCAGLPVAPSDIMGMGVGGLLAEIPGRPQPRSAAPRRAQIAALVLAGGSSRRMGPENKLLLPFQGRPILRHVVEAALASQAGPVLVATGHQADRIHAALVGLDLALTHADAHEDGLSATLRAGLAALPEDIDGVMVLLGDMPLITPAEIDRLIAAFNPAEGRRICVPVQGGRRGNPVLWDRTLVADIMALSGDHGARSLLDQHPDMICEVPMANPGIHLDIDTPDDWTTLNAGG
ncbi:NTP transferase domain-containing protein [Niveispirillum irakense]|uniref:NTP transferase domain-containing protein n=1 Tax=Niveispirillum irakense TaxID=34011 RepID=UPI00040A3E85|nr:molybdopterin-binding/glycosyltransferase family 2 protein [Niveispirillum irakense]